MGKRRCICSDSSISRRCGSSQTEKGPPSSCRQKRRGSWVPWARCASSSLVACRAQHLSHARKADLAKITRERAERIAKAHACVNCGEYSYKRVSVKPATKRLQESLGVTWSAFKTCGVCN